nr:MAG TPA: Putative pectinesterase/pectinesterase inhibitor [Caudoviricetes sp.]
MSNELINRQYVGARYVPKIMGEWNKALQYEALSVVTYKGNSFTSKVPVPANVEINNTNYWVNTANYNAQVEEYRKVTLETKELANNTNTDLQTFKKNQTNTNNEFNNKIDLTTSALNKLKNAVFDGDTPSVITVAKNGGRFHTINEAITFAKKYCGRYTRVTILIFSGVYHESIVLTKNPGIDLIGVGMPEIISDAPYPNGPANIYGDTYIEGIYFHSIGANSYAFHLDGSTDTSCGTTVTVVNCKFVSNNQPALGCGCTRGCQYTFINCLFYGTDGIYVHNEASANVDKQLFHAIGCKINGKKHAVAIDDAPKLNYGATGSPLVLNFANSYTTDNIDSMILFRLTNTEKYGYIPGDAKGISLSPASTTQIVALDYKYQGGYSITASVPTYANSRDVYIPVENANLFEWTVTTTIPGTGIYPSKVTSVNAHWLTVTRDSGNWNGSTIQVDLVGKR